MSLIFLLYNNTIFTTDNTYSNLLTLSVLDKKKIIPESTMSNKSNIYLCLFYLNQRF